MDEKGHGLGDDDDGRDDVVDIDSAQARDDDNDVDGDAGNSDAGNGDGDVIDVKKDSDGDDGGDGIDGDGGLDPSEQLAQLLRGHDLVFQSINEVVLTKPPLVNGRLEVSMVGRDIAIWNLRSANPGWMLVRITKYYAKLEQDMFNYEIKIGNLRMDKLLEVCQYFLEDDEVEAGSWVALKKDVMKASRPKKTTQRRERSLYAYVPVDPSRSSLEEQVLEASKQLQQVAGKSLRSALKRK